MRSARRAALLAAVSLLAWAPAAEALYRPVPWPDRKDAAVTFVEERAGIESFALIDESGRLRGYRPWRVAPSASVLKPMLLVAYLNLASVRGRSLTDRDRSLLEPMIRWSDNTTAGIVLNIVGAAGLYRVAHRADMRHFRVRSPWGLSEITAGDQARFFYRIDSYVPARHRDYARYLLSHIVSSQRWGIPPEAPSGWQLFFKGGWGSGTGRVTHQVALLREGHRRIAHGRGRGPAPGPTDRVDG